MKVKKALAIKHLFIAFLLFAVLLNYSDALYASPNNRRLVDSTKVREVFYSQQLCVVKISDRKKNTKGVETANVKAELRDTYQIVSYHNGHSKVELNWVMFKRKNYPRSGLYYGGTTAYARLDTLINEAKTQKKSYK